MDTRQGRALQEAHPTVPEPKKKFTEVPCPYAWSRRRHMRPSWAAWFRRRRTLRTPKPPPTRVKTAMSRGHSSYGASDLSAILANASAQFNPAWRNRHVCLQDAINRYLAETNDNPKPFTSLIPAGGPPVVASAENMFDHTPLWTSYASRELSVARDPVWTCWSPWRGCSGSGWRSYFGRIASG